MATVFHCQSTQRILDAIFHIYIYIYISIYLYISVSLYLYVYMSANLYVYTYISISVYTSLSLSLYMYIYIYMYIYVYVHRCTHNDSRTFTWTYIYAHMYSYLCIYIYIYMYTHTHSSVPLFTLIMIFSLNEVLHEEHRLRRLLLPCLGGLRSQGLRGGRGVRGFLGVSFQEPGLWVGALLLREACTCAVLIDACMRLQAVPCSDVC